MVYLTQTPTKANRLISSKLSEHFSWRGTWGRGCGILIVIYILIRNIRANITWGLCFTCKLHKSRSRKKNICQCALVIRLYNPLVTFHIKLQSLTWQFVFIPYLKCQSVNQKTHALHERNHYKSIPSIIN